jgi:hypothetical protein
MDVGVESGLCAAAGAFHRVNFLCFGSGECVNVGKEIVLCSHCVVVPVRLVDVVHCAAKLAFEARGARRKHQVAATLPTFHLVLRICHFLVCFYFFIL